MHPLAWPHGFQWTPLIQQALAFLDPCAWKAKLKLPLTSGVRKRPQRITSFLPGQHFDKVTFKLISKNKR
jgi:hypothetical protein